MKIDKHKEDKASYDSSIDLLFNADLIEHRKLIVEGCVLASANVANIVFHLLKKTGEERDIKHNNIEGFILRNNIFGDNYFEISKMFREMEDYKYRVVHGKSKSKEDIEKSVLLYKKIFKRLIELAPELKKILGENHE